MFQAIIQKGVRALHTLKRGRVSAGISVLLLALLLVASGDAAPREYPLGEFASFEPQGDIRRFAGETLDFDISFLVFENAANATVGFYEDDGKYYAFWKDRPKDSSVS